MRYCFFTAGPWRRNGGLIRCRHLGPALIDRGIEVIYVVDDLEDNRVYVELDPRAEIAWVPQDGATHGYATRRSLWPRVSPDFVHVVGPHFKAWAALANMRDLAIVADWDEPLLLHPLPPHRRLLALGLDGWLRRRADRIISCTRYVQAMLRDRHDIDAPYIPHAAYLPAYPDGPSPYDRPTAAYLGGFVPAWDHDIIFEAMRLLKESGSKPSLAIIGEGDDLSRWQEFAAVHGLDNIAFRGWLEGRELWRHLRHATVNLFPIRDTELNRARCPSKTFAYAQARRPVITGSVGEVPELLGATPRYVEQSPEAFASAIHELMSGPRPADVNLRADSHTYADRADRLLHALAELS